MANKMSKAVGVKRLKNDHPLGYLIPDEVNPNFLVDQGDPSDVKRSKSLACVNNYQNSSQVKYSVD